MTVSLYKNPAMKQITIKINPAVHQAFKVYCVSKGVQMSEVLRKHIVTLTAKGAKAK